MTHPTRAQMHKTRSDRAKSAFQYHEIVESESDPLRGRWLIGDRGKAGGNCWAEIACMAHKTLYVGGDIGPLVFAYGPDNYIARVHWMGQMEMPDRYFREKASIGTRGGAGGAGMIEEWNISAALDDLSDLVQMEREEPEVEAQTVDAMEEELRDAILASDDQGTFEVYDLLNRYGHWEACAHFGMVPTTRVYQTHAALHRLSQLLRAQE